MIGIIGAMEVEVAHFKEAMENAKTGRQGLLEFYAGQLHGADIVVCKCGIGKVAAAMCAQSMIEKFAPDLIINTGVAGALSGELKICDIVVASSVVQHDMDTTPIGDPKGFLSELKTVFIKTDEDAADKLFEIITRLGYGAKHGIIASGDQFIADAAVKRAIADEFNAVACEMEGGAMGQVCASNGVPFAVLRAISDGANDGAALDYPKFVKIAADRSIKVMEEFLKNV